MKCEAGVWRCAAGTTPFPDCPPGTCLVNYGSCCDRATGQGSAPTCDNDGYNERCPVGFEFLVRGSEAGFCHAEPVSECDTSSCAPGEYCDFHDPSCTGASKCAPAPASCSPNGPPACGCDGTVYPSACDAQRAGMDEGSGCAEFAGHMLCGTRFCRLGAEYCRVNVLGTGGYESECLRLPPGCTGNGSCACLAGQPCADQCSDAALPKVSCT
jgi:hypothetical protein